MTKSLYPCTFSLSNLYFRRTRTEKSDLLGRFFRFPCNRNKIAKSQFAIWRFLSASLQFAPALKIQSSTYSIRLYFPCKLSRKCRCTTLELSGIVLIAITNTLTNWMTVSGFALSYSLISSISILNSSIFSKHLIY